MMDATAIVLAGGRSSRMGRPKALLPFDDTPLIAHVVGTLRAVVSDVVVVAAPGQELPELPVTLVRDEVAYQGPVGGICYGLATSRGEVSFVTSCDAVFLDPELMRHLVSRAADHDVVVPCWGGRLQPLHAVYRRSVLPQLEGQLARGELRPIHLFDKVRTLRIEEPELRVIDPEGWSFFNMNTPEEYDEALRHWRAVRGDPRGASGRPVRCTVELFGVAQLLTRTREVSLSLPSGATVAQVFTALAVRLPVLIGRVISPDRRRLVEGYACSLNGLEFVRHWSTPVSSGDSIVIVAADAGG